MLMRQQEDIAEPASDFDYNALSPEIKRAVEQGFTGQNFVMEEINPVLGELVVTVGVPVSDAGGKVRAVVLLHSPVQGMREAAWEGIRILILFVRRGAGPGVCPEYAFFVEVYQTAQ